MIVKTKKYQLPTGTYITLALKNVLLEMWWVWIVPVVIMLIPIFYQPAFWWCFGVALTASILFVLFWLIQFAGITQMEQSKILFDRLSYEIDSRQILIKVNAKQGMPITWDKIQKVKKGKDNYLFIVSKGQMIHLPLTVFKTDADIKKLEAILKRKSLIES